MIALDTSAVVATALGEPEAELFHALVSREEILVGWPTLLEIRMVLTGKGFPGAAAIISELVALPNVNAITFGERHYHAAEVAFERFGKGRHPASLNMGDCFSYAVAATSKAPLLFKGRDFSKTDVKLHPASATS